jgi:hypothetical protein
MLVMPDNENEVYFPSNFNSVTFDGGATAQQESCPGFSLPGADGSQDEHIGAGCGGDNHDMWADPLNADRMMIGSDVGVMISTTRGRSWKVVRLPIAQIYHVTVDDRIPYYVYGQMQDGTPQRGPSQVPGDYGINGSQWTTTAGCETGWNVVDPADNNIVWGGCYSGVTERVDLRDGHARSVSVWPDRTMGANAGEVKERMNWTSPIAISPHDHNTVYTGSQYVNRTTDGGQTWQRISPDLTKNDPKMHGDSGGLTVDNLSVEYAGVVYALAESPVEKGQIWAGTNDGQVQVTRDHGKTWTNVTKNIPNLPDNMTVGSIEPSKYAAGTCYVAFDGHQVGVFDPHLYKTTDFGKTWTRITDGIPASPLSYTHVVREDPARKGLLFAGTENGIYVSYDDGAHWQSFQQNLPHAPVYWLAVQPRFHDLVVGTYGRGYWIMDDITPLENSQSEAKTDGVLAVREAYRFRATDKRDMAPAGASVGQNPPYGASIYYTLSREVPKDKLKLEIIDAQGKVVRKIDADNKPGLHHAWWSLRYEPMVQVAVRTTPPGNPHVWEEKRFAGKESRPIFYYGIGGEATDGPLVAPGAYTVRLTVDGTPHTQKVTVLRDPNTTGSDADVAASSELSRQIYEDANESARLINRIEVLRLQLENTRKLLNTDRNAGFAPASATDTAKLLDATKTLDQQLLAQEAKLMHPTIAEGDIKSFRGPVGLYLKFIWLGAEAGSGAADVSGNADQKPTQPELDVFQAAMEGLTTKAVPAYNALLQESGMGRLAAPPVREGGR